jgi:hypothetical protein
MSSSNFYPSVPPGGTDARTTANVIRNLVDGKSNNTGSITLTANATASTLLDQRVGATSVIVLMPKTATAATAMTSVYVSARGTGTATLTHDSNAATDRSFEYAIIG